MTDNEKLAMWQGWEDIYESEYYYLVGHPPGSRDAIKLPDYLNDDAAAMSLLDTLVEKGFVWFLGVDTDELGEIVDIRCKVRHKDSTASINKYADTRREAIIAACLEVARKDQDHDKG